MDKLIQMTDFVLQRNEINGEDYYGYEKTAVECINYAKFLKQSLTLGMFVPCDNEGNVLEKPKNYDIAEPIINTHLNHKGGKKKQEEKPFHDYKKAKEKVLFSGFELPSGEWQKGMDTVVNITLGTTLYLNSGHISIEQNNGIGYGIIKTIQDLVSYGLTITPSALKAIGIE